MTISYEPGAPLPDDVIPLSVPEFHGNEWVYLKECLDSNFVSSVGPFVKRFENDLARRTGSPFAVATVNGTAALHIALLVCGVQPDDEVLVSTLTFIAPVNAIRYAGAWPVFVDSEPEYWQMDVQRVARFLDTDCTWQNGELRNRRSGRRVKAVVPVHILGHPVDMDPLLEAAQKYGLAVIEDATESLGSTYKGRSLGTLGDLGCFSFNGNKVITTGGGGMIVTGNEAFASKSRYLTTQAKDDPIEFIHNEVGYNYRLTNLQAALGCAQLEVLDEYLSRKLHIAARYDDMLQTIPGIITMRQAEWAKNIHWLYTVLVDESKYGIGSRDLMRKLGSMGIQARPFWHPIHSLPLYSGCQALGGDVAENLYKHGLSLPCSVSLTDSQLERVVAAIAGQK